MSEGVTGSQVSLESSLTGSNPAPSIVKLKEVVYDKRARNGTWCKLKYPGHPHGCPNFPKCISKHPDFKTLKGYEWYAVIEKFDLAKQEYNMKLKHPIWSKRQCRCLLYWQGGVRKRLKKKAYSNVNNFLGDIVLEIPEACGVNVFKTMKKVGIKLQRNPDLVIKVMLVGKKNGVS